jgi:RecA-family ATPase
MMTPAMNNALDANAILIDRKRLFTLYRDLTLGETKEWLVKGLLGHGEASAFYGKPGDGKSVLVQDLCMHVAAGWPWHDRPVRRGAVVYIALERRKLVERRALAFRERRRIPDVPFAIVGGVYDFRDPRTAARIVEIARKVEEETGEPVVLIVIDTLSRALCGGDENSPKDMGAIVNASGLLHQGTGAHILWVHHMPLEGERMRGHGALLGAMDTTVHVVKADRIRTATVVKANDSEEGASVAFTLESVTIGVDSDGVETTAPIVMPTEPSAVRASTEPRLSRNQQTMFSILHDAKHLTLEQWNEKTREAGIGVKRKADLVDIRTALKAKGLVFETADHWMVKR